MEDKPVAEAPKSKKLTKIIVIVLAAAVVLGGGGALALRARRVSFANKMTAETWATLSIQSDKVVSIAETDASPEQLRDLSRETRNLKEDIQTRLYLSSQVTRLLNDGQVLNTHESFLQKFNDYVALVSDLAGDIKSASGTNLAKLKELSEAAKQANAEAEVSLKLDKKLPPEIFELGSAVEDAKESFDKAEAEKKRLQQLTQQEELNRQNAEANAKLFMAAYVAGNKNSMKTYMTPSFISEYNFEEVSSEYREYSYPSSFRIVSTIKEGVGFEVAINVVYKVRDPEPGYEQYTHSRLYYMVASGGTWKIDDERYGY